MDLGTIVGLVCAFALILWGIMMGSPLAYFINPPSVVIVVGGSFAIMFVGYPSETVLSAWKVARNAFTTRPRRRDEVLQLMRQMSTRARREGVLALEDVARSQDDEFLRRGIQMVVDGHDPEAIEDVLYTEIDKITERHIQGADFWDYLGNIAPAMGMIGTLIGLVQMLQNLSDPSGIGPAMAVALLTTFYGSVMANVVAIPIGNKLKVRSTAEVAEKALIAQGLLSILSGESPRFLVDRLNVQLPPQERWKEAS